MEKRKPTCWECGGFEYNGSGQEGECFNTLSEHDCDYVNMNSSCEAFYPINGNWEDFEE
jgi:hypothetical protein